MIHRATQWARDLDRDVLYLPHRMGGKLHVLKIENCFAGARLEEALEEKGTVISVDCFLKRDHARCDNPNFRTNNNDSREAACRVGVKRKFICP